MTGHLHPCHTCPTRGAQVQPWRREGSGRMDRTERALGTGGARAAGSSRGERAGSTAADSEGPWPPQRWRCVLRCLTARGPSTFAARRLLQPGAS